MKITRDTPDQLILEHRNWRGPVGWAALALGVLLIAALARGTGAGIARVILVGCGVVIPAAIALLKAERSMLILDGPNRTAELRHRTLRGLHCQQFRLDNVQGTRIASERRHKSRPAAQDPTRKLTLFVKAGMDEGRHPLALSHIPAQEALDASAQVNRWMQRLRRQEALEPDTPPLDSQPAQP